MWNTFILFFLRVLSQAQLLCCPPAVNVFSLMPCLEKIMCSVCSVCLNQVIPLTVSVSSNWLKDTVLQIRRCSTAAPTTLSFVLGFQIVKTVWLPLHLNITKMKKKKKRSQLALGKCGKIWLAKSAVSKKINNCGRT